MPTVAKTSPAEIIAAAKKIVAQDGLTLLSLQSVATAVGVRAPSLYKRFADRATLVRAVALEVVEELNRLQRRAAVTGTATEDLLAIARVHRRYARAWPRLYLLLFSTQREAELPPVAYHNVVAIVLERVAALTGPDDMLNAARLLVAYIQGFISMEIAGAFRLGGDLDEAFDFGVDRILSSLQLPVRSRSARRPR